MISRKLTQMFLSLAALVVLALSALADPGTPGNLVPDIVSDQAAGSVLIYNVYTSSSTNPTMDNTRINITNTNDTQGVLVHLFFIEAATCSVADSYICLTKSQTTSILASDVDPDTQGYLIAVAATSTGASRDFDFLIGDEYVKFASGHAANLGAEAVELIGAAPVVNMAEMTTTLTFNGAQYGRLPRVLALDSIPSPRDGNNTRLIINRIGGDLRTQSSSVGQLFGVVYDELEAGFSFNLNSSRCQFTFTLSDTTPRTTPRLGSIIPAGSVGWLKFWSTASNALLGASINLNNSASATAFNGGHNLHKLTYDDTETVILPVFPAMPCFSEFLGGTF